MSSKAAAPTSAVKRESYFTRFRKRWKRRGVLEIDENHKKYPFTTYVRQGLSECITSTNDVKEELKEEDYGEKVRKDLVSEYDNHKFQFVTYAPAVFESLRHRLGMFPDVYKECICSTESESKYLEFVSNSKSGQNFFLSNDKQLMIKTHTASEKSFFLKILPSYIEHLQKYPHSLLVKFLGVHKLTVNKHEPVYFIIMQSILFPDERISHRYDLKACKAGRYTEVPEDDGNIITVLKDNNFGERKILLGSQSSWFLLQIEHDTGFLRRIGVIDYSLLVGIQSLHQEEIKERKDLAAIFIRTKKSTSRQHSVLKNWAQSPTRKLQPQLSEDSSLSQVSSNTDDVQLPGTVHEEDNVKTKELSQKNSVDGSVGPESIQSAGIRSSVTESELIAQNRRLLPQCRNELHVIDGSEQERYFVGVIDFFTPYGIKKRCESIIKAIKYSPSGQSYSTVHPDVYAERFQKYIKDHVA